MMNERNISFSVVIPIYNTEKWLDRCIESVIKQDYANFEVILVDDGSTDDSAQKCDEWCAKDERIFCIHKKKRRRCGGKKYRYRYGDGRIYCFSG